MGKDDKNLSMCDLYHATKHNRTAPDGAIVKAEVVVFEDGSVHVGGPCVITHDETAIVEALKIGLEMLGYDVDITKNADGHGKGVIVTEVVDPLASLFTRIPAQA